MSRTPRRGGSPRRKRAPGRSGGGRRTAREASRAASREGTRDLVGLDLARPSLALERRPRVAAPLVVGLVLAALLLAVLRIDILRMRYGVADALEREAVLRREQNELVVEMRRLRRPARLAEIARERGFVRPERVIHLPAAAPVAPRPVRPARAELASAAPGPGSAP